MKKNLFVFIFVLMCTLGFSQASIDPSNKIYTYIEKWEAQGILNNLPSIRPYPLFLLKDILNTVITSDNVVASEDAKNLYEEVFNKKWNISFDAKGKFNFSPSGNHYQLFMLEGVEGDIPLFDITSIGYQIKFSELVNRNANVKPRFTSLPYGFKDPSHIGKMDIHLEADAGVAVGRPKFYVQAGINHNSFGYFYGENIIFSPNTEHTANFSAVINFNRLSYNQSLYVLGATDGKGSWTVYPNKFLAMHGVNAKICNWLYASFFEAVIYGDRFDPAYLIPVAPFMMTQSISGYDSDNLIMGVGFSVRPLKGLAFDTLLYIDDINFDEIIKFKFDTKIRGALQTGVKYDAINIPVLDKASLTYTLVTPYMYSHVQNYTDLQSGARTTAQASAVNYQTYTNSGRGLGSQLWPNSDKVSLSVDLEPIKKLKINILGNFIRHANVNESIPTDEAIDYLNAPEGFFTTDGSYNNHQFVGKSEDKIYPLNSSQTSFQFMTQETKMYVVQAGLDVKYTFPKTIVGEFSVGLGYLFEFVKNYGVQNNLFIGKGNENTPDWSSTGKKEKDVAEAKNKWKSQLKDIINNYLTVSFSYKY